MCRISVAQGQARISSSKRWKWFAVSLHTQHANTCKVLTPETNATGVRQRRGDVLQQVPGRLRQGFCRVPRSMPRPHPSRPSHLPLHPGGPCLAIAPCRFCTPQYHNWSCACGFWVGKWVGRCVGCGGGGGGGGRAPETRQSRTRVGQSAVRFHRTASLPPTHPRPTLCCLRGRAASVWLYASGVDVANTCVSASAGVCAGVCRQPGLRQESDVQQLLLGGLRRCIRAVPRRLCQDWAP